MNAIVIITVILVLLTVCFVLEMHKHRKKKCRDTKGELEQLNELLKSIEAYNGNVQVHKGKSGESR